MGLGTTVLWTLGETALKNPNTVKELWDKVADKLWREGRTVAVTGLSGAGKTVLLDHLKSTSRSSFGYAPPGTSFGKESGNLSKMYRGNSPSLENVSPKKVGLIVVPGEEGGGVSRVRILNELFNSKKPPDGVIHVVCNGYISVRHPRAREALVKEAKLETLTEFRQYQLKFELEDLGRIAELIRQSQRRYRKPSWMLIAANKFDLYHEDHLQVEQYYSPYGGGKFVDKLEDLQRHTGRDNFDWDALPVCGWLDDFKWNNETRHSTLNDKHRDNYLLQFAEHLEKRCASE
jgi:hypothetical protein